MKHRSSRNRNARRGASILARSTLVGLALFGAACVELAASGLDSALQAQSIINGARAAGNIPPESFSGSGAGASVSGSFDAGSILEVKLPEPNNVPVVVESSQYNFPFFFPPTANTTGITAIDLLCSPDKGTTWYSYATVLANDKRKEFLFEAPRPGEYWFVLMTSFKTGKRSYSSSRTMTFTEGTEPQKDNFALADDSGEDSNLPAFESLPQAPSNPGVLSELSDLSAPTLPSQNEGDDELLISNASFAGEDAQPEPTMPTAPNTGSVNLDDAGGTGAGPARLAWPGKLRVVTFGAGKKTEKLMVTVRWFHAADLKAEDRIDVKSLDVERAPTESGPWTIVGEDLDVTQDGYSWTATAEEMKPFYVRLVAHDAQGNVWRDVTTAPLDVNDKSVRNVLGPVKTPVPFTDVSEKKGDADESDDASNETKEKTKLIRHTASEDDGEEEGEDAVAIEARSETASKKGVRLVSTVERSQARSSAVARERPDIPPPTNPNEFQLNPLFTQGFSVLYQSSQARMEPSTGKKRSIFTPPTRAQRDVYVRPAERRLSQQQLQQARVEQERRAYQERLKYNREHEMETFQQKPELMEGRMFYMDSNGNLTTTPPPEMQQALNYGNMEAQGWTRVDAGQPAGTSNDVFSPNESEPLYMPRNSDAYDSSARSGAVLWSNPQYPQPPGPGSSPINNRYSDGAGAAPQGTNVGAPNVAPQVPPQSSYMPSNNLSPYYVSNASASEMEFEFPPRPDIAQ